MSNWAKYIAYLKDWAEAHKDESYEGMSPAGYDEWQDNERYYLVLEDDDTTEDVYPRDEETLMETFVRVLDANIEREPGLTEVLHKLRKEYPNLDIECTLDI